MHQVEKLSSYFRLKPTATKPEEAFVPLPFEDYIVIYNDEALKSNTYHHFNDVVEYIKTSRPDVNIVQVANTTSTKQIEGAYCIDNISHNQLHFLINNCECIVSTETYAAEAAGVFNKPLVFMSGNSFSGTARPFFFNEDIHHIIAPAEQPSFMSSAEHSVVNTITPEDVARPVLSFIGLKDPDPSYKTVFVGESYHNRFIDYVPDFHLESNISGNIPLTVRLDLCFNISNVISTSSHSILHLVIDKEFDLKTISDIRDKIPCIIVELNNDMSVEFIKDLQEMGCQVILHTKDKENLDSIRFKFIDWHVLFTEKAEKPKDIDDCNNLFYKSGKLTVSNNKKYISYAAKLENKEDNKVVDREEFWEDSDHYMIYSLDLDPQ
tara:strand:- start:4936 stop:6075 length:1140 start_codon:yes stop_codon:yes gene_type:complete